jgi:hypothetical protein
MGTKDLGGQRVRRVGLCLLVAVFVVSFAPPALAASEGLHVGWKDNFLTISGRDLPGGDLKIHYLEAYCRPGSTNRNWQQTLIGHQTRLVSADADGRRVKLQCTLDDGVVVDHEIVARADEVEFRITATNPTDKASQADWAQPCIRVGTFTGRGKSDYLSKCFIFLDGKLARMPTRNWATRGCTRPGRCGARRA